MRRKATFTALFLALIILLGGCYINIDPGGQVKSTTETVAETTTEPVEETTINNTDTEETTTTEAPTTTTEAPTEPPTEAPTEPAETTSADTTSAETTPAPSDSDDLPASVKKYKGAFEGAGYNIVMVEGIAGEGGTLTFNDGTEGLTVVYFEAETKEVFDFTMDIMIDMVSSIGDVETIKEDDMYHATVEMEGAALFELHAEGKRLLFLTVVLIGEDKTEAINEIYSLADMTRPEG